MDQRNSVFKDEAKLSPRHIPSKLPHRDEEISLLLSFFKDSLDNITESYLKTIQIIGGVGSGKTCTDIRFAQILTNRASEKGITLNHIYINLKLQGRSKVVLYREIVEQGAPEIYSTSLSAEELLRQLVKYLQKEKKYLIITLDEIDYYLRIANQQIIYDLTRLNELYPDQSCGVIGLIVIARDKDFHQYLDKSELSTLGRNFVEFKPYNVSQIINILEERVAEAFKPKALSPEVLEYVADITVEPPVNCDIRYALDLLLYSGHLADNEGSAHIRPEHVRKVHSETYHPITSEDIQNLSVTEKHVLLGIVRSLKTEGSPYVSLNDIRTSVDMVCEEHNIRKMENIEDHVQSLNNKGIIEVKSLTKIGMSGLSAEDLSKYLDNLIEKVESDLDA